MSSAVYAGTFDPITFGHLSVIERATHLFEKVWVVVAVNPDKQPLFSLTERVEMLKVVTRTWPNVQCASTEGYVIEFARQVKAQCLIRGVRNTTDSEVELRLASLNRMFAPEISTVFLPTYPELSEVSSSRLKDLARLKANLAQYCPPEIVTRLQERVGTPSCPNSK